MQYLAQPPLGKVEQRSLEIFIRTLAHLRQEPAGNLTPSPLLQVVGACRHVLPSVLDSLSSGVNRGVQQALHWLGKSCKRWCVLSWQASRKGWGPSFLAEQKWGNETKKQLPL